MAINLNQLDLFAPVLNTSQFTEFIGGNRKYHIMEEFSLVDFQMFYKWVTNV